MSCAAPVETSFVRNSSPMRPPQHIVIASRKYDFERFRTSFSGRLIVTPSARPRGMMLTLWSGSAFGRSSWRSAWPASCQAVVSYSLRV